MMMKKFCFMALLLLMLGSFLVCGALDIVPRQRYRIDFEVAATKEVYPDEWRLLGVEAVYPKVELLFYNSRKQRVRPMMGQDVWYVDSKGYTKGYFEFYAPDTAVSCKVQNRNTRTRNIKITKVAVGKQRAIPLHVRRSGGFRRSQTTFTGNGGEALYDISFGGFSGDLIPVKAGEKYRLHVLGAAGFRGTGLVIRIGFYRNSNSQKSSIKSGGGRMRIGRRAKGQFTTEFIVPQGANWMRMSCMWGQLHSYTFEKL